MTASPFGFAHGFGREREPALIFQAFATVCDRLWPSVSVSDEQKTVTLLDLCVSSLRRGHSNLLCIVPILTDDPRRESVCDRFGRWGEPALIFQAFATTCDRVWPSVSVSEAQKPMAIRWHSIGNPQQSLAIRHSNGAIQVQGAKPNTRLTRF